MYTPKIIHCKGLILFLFTGGLYVGDFLSDVYLTHRYLGCITQAPISITGCYFLSDILQRMPGDKVLGPTTKLLFTTGF